MILTIACLLFLALVAYWWGNLGVFDAFVHLTCVIVSGALAIALWEPICLSFFQTSSLAEFGWGLSLGVPFLALLFATRMATDKLCPTRPKVARWADWALGAPMGMFAGVLTFGLTLIAAGHVAGARELAGFEGWKREPGHAEPVQTDPNSPGALCVGVTQSFFNMLSTNAFSPFLGHGALGRLRPAMGADGASLLRDSIDAGKGRLSVTSDGIAVSSFYHDPNFGLKAKGKGAFAVLLSAKSPSFENGAGFVLSASQARLINGATGACVFPAEWSQREEKSGQSLVRHDFNGDTSYVVTPNGESPLCLIFPSEALGDPKGEFYLQVKGLRFQLEPAKADAKAMSLAVLNGGKAFEKPKGLDDAPKANTSDLYQTVLLPDGIHLDETSDHGTLLLEGKNLRFSMGDAKGGGATLATTEARRGSVCQFEESPAARVVLLRCSNGSSVEIFDNDPRRRVDVKAQPVLLDAANAVYEPCGYIMRNDREYEIMLEEKDKFPFNMGNFRRAGKGGEVYVIYRVPEGSVIQAVLARNPQGDFSSSVPLAKADLKIVPKS